MTDRFNALVVVLDRDIRSDDAEPLIAAIKMLRGVLSVTPHASDMNDHIAEMRIRNELTEKIWKALHPKS